MTTTLRKSSPRTRDHTTRNKRWASPRSLFIVPALALTALFYFVPTVLNFGLAFTDWNSYRDEIRFIGFSNFQDLVAEGALANSLQVTITFALAVVIIQNVLGLTLAVALEKTNGASSFFRVIFFLPVLISPLAAGYIFTAILSVKGPLNSALGAVAGAPVPIEWLGSTTLTVFVLAAITAWKSFGLTMLIYIAGLNSIPEDVVESAQIDGASPWRAFWSVRFPLLAPAVTFNVVFTLVGAMNTFDIVFATTRGGPGTSTQLFNIFVQQQYATGFFGYAVSMTVVLLVCVVAGALPAIVLLRRREVTL